MTTDKSGQLAAAQTELPAVIEVENLSRRFGKVKAVNNVSFSVFENEIFALLGPNGSGKSSLLRMLCGYLQPSSGGVAILGHSLQDEPRIAKSTIGYVPDEGGLYLHMRVGHFLGFMARIKNIPPNERSLCLERVVETLKLESVLNKRISVLSRGYRQRVSIAQALINQPSVVLMDEPTNGLDPNQIRQWRELMATLKENCSVVFTSHILDEVTALADRVGMLVDGELCAVASLNDDTAYLAITVEARDLEWLQSNTQLKFKSVGRPEKDLIEVTMKLGARSVPETIAELVTRGVRIYGAKRVKVDLESSFFAALDRKDGNQRAADYKEPVH